MPPCHFFFFLTSLLQSRPPASSLERCCDSCFNKIRSRVRHLSVSLLFFLPHAHGNTFTSVTAPLPSYFLVLLLQVLQSSSSPSLPPIPFPSKLADASPVAPPSFDQHLIWQQQQEQQPHNPSTLDESSSPIPDSTSSSAQLSAGNFTRHDASRITRDPS
jgi:hypothetical protein